jgi:hypothetical protein
MGRKGQLSECPGQTDAWSNEDIFVRMIELNRYVRAMWDANAADMLEQLKQLFFVRTGVLAFNN